MQNNTIQPIPVFPSPVSSFDAVDLTPNVPLFAMSDTVALPDMSTSLAQYGSGLVSGGSGTQAGSGNSIFGIDPQLGIWLGAALFANAPFSVDMSGNLTASKGTFTGNLKIGGLIINVATTDDIQTAINTVNAAGGGQVVLSNGTHTLSSDITLYSNVSLVGQNSASSIIDFQSTAHSIKAVGSNAYTTGTLSVSNNSQSVVGVGTTWTNAMVGRSILLSGIWYPIVAVGSTTTLTIAFAYAGNTLAASTYTIASVLTNITLDSLTIQNSTSNGVSFNYTNDSQTRSLTFINCTTGFSIQNTSALDVFYTIPVACGTGFSASNTYNIVIRDLLVVSSTTAGVVLNTCQFIDGISIEVLNTTGVGISFTSVMNTNLSSISSRNSSGIGMELVSGNANIAIFNVDFRNNGSDGLKLTASSNDCYVTLCNFISNGGYGLNIANSNCNRTLVIGNNFSSNSSGAASDSGTTTKISTNQGLVDNNSTTAYKNGTTTKNLADASTTQNIAHGLGRTPSKIRMSFSTIYGTGTAGLFGFGNFSYEGTTKATVGYQWNATDGTYYTMAGTDIVFTTQVAGSSPNNQTGVVTMDSTNIVITWTKSNTPAGTVNIMWEAEG